MEPDTSAASSGWTRTWVNRLDEVSAISSPSSVSTPVTKRPPPSPSQSSVDLSDGELPYSYDTEEVLWNTEDDDVTRSLPTELLLHIMALLSSRDLVRAMLVSKAWCLAAFPLIWQKPPLKNIRQFEGFVRVLALPDPLLPYAPTVRRLVFNGFAKDLTDSLFSGIGACKNLERLTLPAASGLTSKSLNYVFGKLRNLIAIDLGGVDAVDDLVVHQISNGCPNVQGLNLAKCTQVTDEGVLAIAARSKMLRRIKLTECKAVTDRSVITLTRSCPLLLELDLAYIPQLSDDTTLAIFFNCAGLRELRLNENGVISEKAIPNLDDASRYTNDQLLEMTGAYPWYIANAKSPKAMWRKSASPPDIDLSLLRPITRSFDQLRIVDFTKCERLGDWSIDNLITNAPQLRNLTLARCANLTDAAVYSISRLGKHLHYLHLGHVTNITDESITHLARTCTRLRYIDLSNCSDLTDRSVVALATNLPKLRRMGLVKIVNITDQGIVTLAEREGTLERLHLSYCDNISIKAISFLLNRLPLLAHLSLTGVSAFKTPELQQFCRPPPSSYNAHQRASFCVYSGSGVAALRNYLDSVTFDMDASSPESAASPLSTSLEGTPTEWVPYSLNS